MSKTERDKMTSEMGRAVMTSSQRRLCRDNLALMPAVATAAQRTADICQQEFADRRWNCSSVLTAPSLTPDLTGGSREQAYVYGLSAASLVYSIARACHAGVTPTCGCQASNIIPISTKEYRESQLSDNIVTSTATYASDFKETTKYRDTSIYDTQMTESDNFSAFRSTTLSSREDLRSKMSRSIGERGEKPWYGFVDDSSARVGKLDLGWNGCEEDAHSFAASFSEMFTDEESNKRRGASVRSAVNLHNSAVGRKVVSDAMKTSCKCHGVSGSCTAKTCWKSLPDMRTVSFTILQYYTQAVQVSSGRFKLRTLQGISLLVPVTAGRNPLMYNELAFYTISPDYCLPDVALGSVGTQQRECMRDVAGSGGCRSMCCGRGYITYTDVVTHRCDCQYYWCCYVTCRTCVTHVDLSRCR